MSPSKIGILTLLFVFFYLLFILLSPFIHTAGTQAEIHTITPWLQPWLSIQDGIELYVMTFFMPLYLLSGFLITRRSIPEIKLLSDKRIHAFFGFVILSAFIANYFWKEHPESFKHYLIIFFLCLLPALIIIRFSGRKFSLFQKSALFILFFLFLVLIGFAVNNPPHIFDYSYYIGPANKILQGEMPGSFYMQYNLLGTYLFALMQKMNLGINGMFTVLVLIFSFWIVLYAKAGSLFFRNKAYTGLFVLTLVLVRCLAISEGPLSQPQVSTLRMDLWVPLLIILYRFGFTSIYTATAFSLCYLADDVFGLLYLLLYLFTLSVILLSSLLKPKSVSGRINPWLGLFPVCAAFLIHYLLFHGFFSPASLIYSNIHIGFMPISLTSSFWFVAFLLPIGLYLLSQDKKNILVTLFIFAIACIQLTYFFGRSHDHNLLNISGIFIFILFLTLDRLSSSFSGGLSKPFIATVCMIVLIGFNYASSVSEKINLAEYKIKRHSLIETHPTDDYISLTRNYIKSLSEDRIIFLSEIDAYLNYRLGYRQEGYFSPFCANLYAGETVDFLNNELSHGYRLIVYPVENSNLAEEICALNQSPFMISNTRQFRLIPLKYGLMEIKN